MEASLVTVLASTYSTEMMEVNDANQSRSYRMPIVSGANIGIAVDESDRELISIEAEGEYLRLHLTEEREILVFKRLKSLLSELPFAEFKQIHRSNIININHIDTIDFHEVEMRNKQIFSVGKTYKAVIQDILRGNTTTL
jgi:DNA-binding LytR/AlgR family response regulator